MPIKDTNTEKKEQTGLLSFTDTFKDFIETNPREYKVYCMGIKPVVTFKQLKFYSGGEKESFLCGFKFKTHNRVHQDAKIGEFMVFFVCKLRSKIGIRAGGNASMWYMWTLLPNKVIQVLSEDELYAKTGFKMSEFVKTDMFAKWTERFKKNIVPEIEKIKRVKDRIEKTKRDIDRGNKDAVQEMIHALEESVDRISSPVFNDKGWTMQVFKPVD